MKKEKAKEIRKSNKDRIILWVKEPQNIFLLIIMLAITIIGIINKNLDIILIVYIGAFLYGFAFRGISFLISKIKGNK